MKSCAVYHISGVCNAAVVDLSFWQHLRNKQCLLRLCLCRSRLKFCVIYVRLVYEILVAHSPLVRDDVVKTKNQHTDLEGKNLAKHIRTHVLIRPVPVRFTLHTERPKSQLQSSSPPAGRGPLMLAIRPWRAYSNARKIRVGGPQ